MATPAGNLGSSMPTGGETSTASVESSAPDSGATSVGDVFSDIGEHNFFSGEETESPETGTESEPATVDDFDALDSAPTVPANAGAPVATEPAPQTAEPALGATALDPRLNAIGGEEGLTNLTPLFEGFDMQSEEGRTKAAEIGGQFMEFVESYDPSISLALLYGTYGRHEDLLASWVDASRGWTPETVQAFQEWQQNPAPAAPAGQPAEAAFPQPDAENYVIFPQNEEFPDGLELNLNDARDRAIYKGLKSDHEADAARRKTEQERVQTEANTRKAEADNRVQTFTTGLTGVLNTALDQIKIEGLEALGGDYAFIGTDFVPAAIVGLVYNDPEMAGIWKRGEDLAKQGGSRINQLKVDYTNRLNAHVETVVGKWNKIISRMTKAEQSAANIADGGLRLPKDVPRIQVGSPDGERQKPTSLNQIFDDEEADRFLQP